MPRNHSGLLTAASSLSLRRASLKKSMSLVAPPLPLRSRGEDTRGQLNARVSSYFQSKAGICSAFPLRVVEPRLPQHSMKHERKQVIFTELLAGWTHFVYLAQSADPSRSGIFVGALDSNERKLVRAANSKARYSPPGFLLFVLDGKLVAQTFDARRFQLAGEPTPIAERIRCTPISGIAAFSVSETGVLTFVADDRSDRGQMTWFDRAGKQLGVLGDPGWHKSLELSPDGRRAAVSLADHAGQTLDIWLYDVARGLRTRFTFDPADEVMPIWSADGSRIIFGSNRKGRTDLFQKVSSGTGTEEVLLEDNFEKYPYSWSPNGQFILYLQWLSPFDLWVLQLSGNRKAFPFLTTPFVEAFGQISPDGRWIAYGSTESGRPECMSPHYQDPGASGRFRPSAGVTPMASRWE